MQRPRNRPSDLAPVFLVVALLFSCGRSDPKFAADAPDRPGVALQRVPAAAIMNARFELIVRINDEDGDITQAANGKLVSVRLMGAGALTGTLQRTVEGGTARFDDLRYNRWESINLSIEVPGFEPLVTPSILVRPTLRFMAAPPVRVRAGELLGPFDIDLVDGQGAHIEADHTIQLISTDPNVVLDGPALRSIRGGRVTYGPLMLDELGMQTLSWHAPGLSPLAHGVMVYADTKSEALWLPPARVGTPYLGSLPDDERGFAVSEGKLPAGLLLDPESGGIRGVPSEAGYERLEITSTDGSGVVTTWKTGLSVLPRGEPAPPMEELDRPGPYTVGALPVRIDVRARSIVEDARVLYPQQAGAPAAGRFPLVIFHHGVVPLAFERPIGDRFDHLLRRWVSWGFVVVAVESPSTIIQGVGYLPVSLANLSLMAENMRAALAFMRARSRDVQFLLHDRVDLDRVFLAGHSRGGGAALIAARSDPTITAAVLLKPQDPLTAPGGEMSWAGPLPDRPFLIAAASDDADVRYPVSEFLFERRRAEMSLVEILGSVHNFTCEPCPVERNVQPSITREQDWAITNAYAVGFLRYLGHGDIRFAQLIYGRAGQSSLLSPRGILRQSDRRGSALLLDDHQDADPMRNTLGGVIKAEGFTTSIEQSWLPDAAATLPPEFQRLRGLYQRADLLAQTKARVLRWTSEATFSSDLGGRDVSALSSFVLRAQSAAVGVTSRVNVRFVDVAGASATWPLGGATGAVGLASRFADVVFSLSDMAAAGVDLRQLARVELRASGTGQLIIDDLRFE